MKINSVCKPVCSWQFCPWKSNFLLGFAQPSSSVPPCVETRSMWGVALSITHQSGCHPCSPGAQLSRSSEVKAFCPKSFLIGFIRTHNSRELTVESSNWDVQETGRCDTKGPGLVGMDSWLDLVILLTFSKLNHGVTESWCHIFAISQHRPSPVPTVGGKPWPLSADKALLAWLSLLRAALCLRVHCHLMDSSPESPKSILQNCRDGLKKKTEWWYIWHYSKTYLGSFEYNAPASVLLWAQCSMFYTPVTARKFYLRRSEASASMKWDLK